MRARLPASCLLLLVALALPVRANGAEEGLVPAASAGEVAAPAAGAAGGDPSAPEPARANAPDAPAAAPPEPPAAVEAPFASEPPLDLFDEVIAQLTPGGSRGTRILLTRSDLELETRVLLVSRGAAGAAEAPIPEDTLAASLDWLVAEHLFLAEAEQLDVAAVEPSTLERELETFRGRFADEQAYAAFLDRNEIGEADLARILRRRLVVGGYVGSRLRLGMSISEGEIQRAFEARQAEFGDSSYEWVRPRLRAQLEREKREAMVAALVADLRSRAEVRILVHLGGAREASSEPQRRPWYLADPRESVD